MGGKAHSGKRVCLEDAQVLSAKIVRDLLSSHAASRVLVAGSIRRKKPEVGDIDLLLEPLEGSELDRWLRGHFGTLTDGYTPARSGIIEGVQVDIMITSADAWGAAAMHCTGSKETNIAMRAKAKKMGYKLNEKGLWLNDLLVGCSHSEEAIYKQLEVEWHEPEDR